MAKIIDFDARRGVVHRGRPEVDHRRPWLYVAAPGATKHRGWGETYTVSLPGCGGDVGVGYVAPEHEEVASLDRRRKRRSRRVLDGQEVDDG